MLRGFATLTFWAADHEAAQAWYTEFLGVEPYYRRPGYVEFRLGDYQHEFGIIDGRYAPPGTTGQPAGAIMYWHVDDLEATVERLLSMGAKEHQPIREQGDGSGFVTASMVDPFGNVLGVMRNPHYLAVLDGR
ncbi:VOC family protein [Nonomuraea sp. NPDC049419]|uniref:VOC family protein n=1 Tax=Nonomuraea sp. NPDC049419 TaxID=3155772 RepID=UPI003421C5C8